MLQWSFLAVQLCRTLASPTPVSFGHIGFSPSAECTLHVWDARVSLTHAHTRTHTHTRAKPTRRPPTLKPADTLAGLIGRGVEFRARSKRRRAVNAPPLMTDVASLSSP